MAAARKRTVTPKPVTPAPTKIQETPAEPLSQVLINMVIGIATVAVMALIVIGMIRMIG